MEAEAKFKNQKERSFLQKNKIYIISSLFFVSFLILIIFFIWPAMDGIKKESENLILVKKEIAVFLAQSSQLEKFGKNYNNYLPDLEKISKIFVDQQNPLDFIEFLEERASGARIDLEISPLFFSKEENYNIAALQLVAKGGFQSIASFLEKIENGPYLIEIQNLNIRNFEDKKTSTKGIQANFSIKALAK